MKHATRLYVSIPAKLSLLCGECGNATAVPVERIAPKFIGCTHCGSVFEMPPRETEPFVLELATVSGPVRPDGKPPGDTP